MMTFQLINNIKEYFQNNPLPGIEAQIKMAPPDRSLYKPNEKVKLAGVLILLYHTKNELFTVFIQRNKYPGVHSGQISLPGGKVEKKDKNITETAIRETKEELGLTLDQLDIIGSLTPLYIPVSNFKVYPTVGVINYLPEFKPDIKEVENVIEIELINFMKSENINDYHYNALDKKIKAPCYLINDNKIWGATAMIMSEFSEILKKIMVSG